MLIEPRKIKVTADSELARLLEEVEEATLILEKDGVLYRLKKEGGRAKRPGKTTGDYEAFLAAAGSWRDVDTDKFIADTYESRRLSSRPPVEL